MLSRRPTRTSPRKPTPPRSVRGDVIDRALACATFVTAAPPEAATQRRKAYRAQTGMTAAAISILERLGRVLLPLSPADLEAYRQPSVTWPAVQKLVTGTPPEALLEGLGTLARTVHIDGRSQRRRRSRKTPAPALPSNMDVVATAAFDPELAVRDGHAYFSALCDRFFKDVVHPYWWYLEARLTGLGSMAPVAPPASDIPIDLFAEQVGHLRARIRDYEARRGQERVVSDEDAVVLRAIQHLRHAHELTGGYQGWDMKYPRDETASLPSSWTLSEEFPHGYSNQDEIDDPRESSETLLPQGSRSDDGE